MLQIYKWCAYLRKVVESFIPSLFDGLAEVAVFGVLHDNADDGDASGPSFVVVAVVSQLVGDEELFVADDVDVATTLDDADLGEGPVAISLAQSRRHSHLLDDIVPAALT